MSNLAQAFFDTLLKTQHLEQPKMLIYQRQLLERLLRHARQHVPFYRRGRLDVLFDARDQVQWERWEDVPVLTRPEAQENSTALYSEFLPKECGEVVSGMTSGSTGRPLEFRANGLVSAANTALVERGYFWAKVPPPSTVCWIKYDYAGAAPYPNGATYQDTIRGTTRNIHTLSIATDIDDQISWLKRRRPNVVIGYPNALATMGERLAATEPQQSFDLVVCVGEVTSDDARRKIEESFGCMTMDVYSGSEFGVVAVEDPSLHRLFVSEEAVFVELLPRPALGHESEKVVEPAFTPLYNYAMPLIRYATGDFAVADYSPASDRRSLRRLHRVLGRQRNVFVMPSGLRWWPTYTFGEIRKFLAFEQIQIAQTARDCIEIRFVSRQPDPIGNEVELMGYLRSATPEAMAFTLVRSDHIARRPSGKFEDAVCEIG